MIHLAWTMANVARLLRDRDIVCLADDDQQADALAGALRAALPDHPILFIPSSDALPGDVAPASPANIGSRVAALHALRLAQQTRDRKHLACVLSGEAAARLYPPPDAFDSAPPRLEIGDPVDVGEFAALIEEVGYFADDRVDEPGEMAVRGDVIDIFPADAGQPARIEIVEGKIASIRSFDPVTQLSVTDLERLEIGRAAEPATDKPTAILSHLRPGAILLTEKADKRRRRSCNWRPMLPAGGTDDWTRSPMRIGTLRCLRGRESNSTQRSNRHRALPRRAVRLRPWRALPNPCLARANSSLPGASATCGS